MQRRETEEEIVDDEFCITIRCELCYVFYSIYLLVVHGKTLVYEGKCSNLDAC